MILNYSSPDQSHGMIIQSMSIVDLLQIKGGILGVNDAGFVVWWDLSEIKRVQGTYIFKDNISLVASKGSIRIDNHALHGIKLQQDSLIMYDQKDTATINKKYIQQLSIKEERMKNILTINASIFLQKKEVIFSLEANNAGNFVIGTNKSNIYVYDYKQNSIVCRHTFDSEVKPNPNELINFITTPKQFIEVNSLASYGEREFILAGLSNGKVYSLRAETLQTSFNMTQASKQALQGIQKIVVGKNEQKIYCLHENYITEWSIKLGQCLSYIEYAHPKDLLCKGSTIIIIGNHSKLIWYDSIQKECKLSMRSASCIREFSHDHVAIGGSDGIIDIFMGDMRAMTLFHPPQ